MPVMGRSLKCRRSRWATSSGMGTTRPSSSRRRPLTGRTGPLRVIDVLTWSCALSRSTSLRRRASASPMRRPHRAMRWTTTAVRSSMSSAVPMTWLICWSVRAVPGRSGFIVGGFTSVAGFTAMRRSRRARSRIDRSICNALPVVLGERSSDASHASSYGKYYMVTPSVGERCRSVQKSPAETALCGSLSGRTCTKLRGVSLSYVDVRWPRSYGDI